MKSKEEQIKEKMQAGLTREQSVEVLAAQAVVDQGDDAGDADQPDLEKPKPKPKAKK